MILQSKILPDQPIEMSPKFIYLEDMPINKIIYLISTDKFASIV